MNLLYTPSIDCDIIDEESFYKKLESVKDREIENASSLYGIQRDDIKLFINGNEVRIFASQGQQRTAVLSLKMAQMEHIKETRDEYPVLLLDDIMSELDITRRTYLANRIKGKQVIITCTDSDMADTDEGTGLFKVENGKILQKEANN